MKWLDRDRLPHELPHWVDTTREAFFITVNCRPRGENQLAKPEVWKSLLGSLEHREALEQWHWPLCLAMPDHFHGIVTFPKCFFMRKTMASWKRWTSRQLGIEWQDDFFDHRLRDEGSLMEKAKYIRMNPVRAGLIEAPELWPFVRDLRKMQ